MNESPSTVSRATREMSEEQLLAVARRYESLARDAYAAARQRSTQPTQKIVHQDAPHESLIDLDGESTSAPAPQVVTNHGNPFLSPVVPSGEGTSRQKGKGP
jgi:hypothetical protein